MNGSIYVDFDDVLCETARTLTDIVAEHFGRRTRFEDIFSFDLNVSFGLNTEEQKVLFSFFHDNSILGNVPPVPGAIDGIRAWAKAGCTVHIVTGRPPETHDISRVWLEAHNVPYADITFVDKYGRGHNDVPGVRQMTLDELETCAFALVVDDSLDMARFFAERSHIPVALFDRPWNRDLEGKPLQDNVVRCQSWHDLITCFPCPCAGGAANKGD